MPNLSSFDFASFIPVNSLWPNFVEHFGLEKAQIATRQALDLQRMHGSNMTAPVLLSETCGIALIHIDLLYSQTGFSCEGEDIILILSLRKKLFQLLRET